MMQVNNMLAVIFMRHCLFIVLTFLSISIEAQKLDSVKFSNGFLFYHEYGKGKTIILLTGGPGNDCMQLSEMAIKLSISRRIILFEQRGTGRSTPVPLDSTTINLKSSVSDINLLLAHLNLKEVILCGHSWGATLAMYYASLYPNKVTSLILVDPSSLLMGSEMFQTVQYNMQSRWSKDDMHQLDSLNQRATENKLTAAGVEQFSYIYRLAYVSDKRKLDSLIPKINVPRNMEMLQLIYKDINKSNIDLRKSLKSFRHPVYLISGRQDMCEYVCYELKIRYPSFKLYWIQNSGHFPMYEQPETFYEVIFHVLQLPI
jgi:proline iminopeptidase